MFNSTGFFWWVGVVEDRNDPLFLGRCKVRIFGYHTHEKSVLPTTDLPWAMPMQPITSAAVSGIGRTPTGPVEGTWVVGFFADGDDCQQPIMMGTFAGIPFSDFYNNSSPQDGFRDPNNKYPLKTTIDEPDTNRLARNQNTTETIVQDKKDNRERAIDGPFGQSWNQPPIPYAAKYPFNHVTQSESGHIIEIDDTPDAERLHVYHKKGSFVEMDPTGSMVRRIVGDDYQIIDNNGYIQIKGKANVTVEGTANIYVKNNCNIEVNGDTKMFSHGNLELKAGKNLVLAAKDKVRIHSDESVDVTSKKGINVKAETLINLTSKIKTTVASPMTEVASLKFNAMAMMVLPPKPTTINDVGTINSRNTSEPVVVSPAFILTAEEREAFKLELDEALARSDVQSDEYASLRQFELGSNERVSVATDESVSTPISCDAVVKMIEAAKRDIGVLETGTAANNGAGKNYGGRVGGGETPVGQTGRIDEMVRLTGLNNQAEVNRIGQGYYWCAAAVTAWWKEAGLEVPPGSASCRNWATWAKQKGLYSTTPKLGAAILYGNPGSEHHIGIVSEIMEDGSIKTIEGNTSGGGFNRNGCGVFVKRPNPRNTYAFVLPPDCDEPVTEQPTVESDCMSEEMKAYVASLKDVIPERVRLQIPEVVCKFAIDTPLRMAHFLSQCAHESGNFRYTREIWGPTRTQLRYETRTDLGNTQPGDGQKFKGRGYIQLTGRVNYQAFRNFIPEDCVENPEIVADKYPLLSAAWFWKTRNINTRADEGTAPTVVRSVTRAINGGYNGLDDRQRKFNQFISLA